MDSEDDYDYPEINTGSYETGSFVITDDEKEDGNASYVDVGEEDESDSSSWGSAIGFDDEIEPSTP